MRDQMKNGQLAFFYHSNCKTPGIAGIVEVHLLNIKLIFFSVTYIQCYVNCCGVAVRKKMHKKISCVLKVTTWNDSFSSCSQTFFYPHYTLFWCQMLYLRLLSLLTLLYGSRFPKLAMLGVMYSRKWLS